MSGHGNLILDSLGAIGYPTVREIQEYMSARDPDFVGLAWARMSSIIWRDGPSTLRSFAVNVRYANKRLYHIRPPVRREPSIALWPKKRRTALHHALSTGIDTKQFGDASIIKDESRPVWYVISGDLLIGVYDGRRSEFRFPSVRTRNEPPLGPGGDGWSETAYVSHEYYADRETFLMVSGC